MVSMLDSKLLSRFEPWQRSLHCALGQSTFQNSCNASLHPIVYMGSTEFNTRGNPAMDWHLIHAIQTAICSNSSMDHHPFEIITFFWDQWATWEDNVVLRKHYIKWPLNKYWNGSFQNHSFQRHENKQKLSLTQRCSQWSNDKEKPSDNAMLIGDQLAAWRITKAIVGSWNNVNKK